MHAPLGISLGHFLVQDAAAGCHPLHIAGRHLAFVTEAIAVLHGTREHVGDRFDSAMRMPGESRQIVFRVVVTEVIEQQKRIEIPGFAESESTLQPDTRSFDSGLRFNNSFNWPE
jgi:hypothetical protein